MMAVNGDCSERENVWRVEYSSPMEADAFEILGIEPGFEVDLDEVERAFLSRLGSIHPDVAGADDVEAARLNAAREVIEDPERRAWALLSRITGGAKVQDRSLPDGFLSEILEIREEVEAALASGDAAGLATWKRWAGERRGAHISRVASMFRTMQGGGKPDDAFLRDLVRELNAWRYIERLIEQWGSERGGEPPSSDDRAR